MRTAGLCLSNDNRSVLFRHGLFHLTIMVSLLLKVEDFMNPLTKDHSLNIKHFEKCLNCELRRFIFPHPDTVKFKTRPYAS